MAAVEWNKKEDLVAEQALKHLKQYCPLLKVSTRSGKSELALMLKVQEFCYENMNFLKSFQKIIMLMYKSKFPFWLFYESEFPLQFLYYRIIVVNSSSHVSSWCSYIA